MVWDTTSRSTKRPNMLDLFGGMVPLAPLAAPIVVSQLYTNQTFSLFCYSVCFLEQRNVSLLRRTICHQCKKCSSVLHYCTKLIWYNVSIFAQYICNIMWYNVYFHPQCSSHINAPSNLDAPAGSYSMTWWGSLRFTFRSCLQVWNHARLAFSFKRKSWRSRMNKTWESYNSARLLQRNVCWRDPKRNQVVLRLVQQGGKRINPKIS